MWGFKKKKEQDILNINRCSMCEKYNKQSAKYGICSDVRNNNNIYFAYKEDNNKVQILVPRYGICKYFKKRK